MRPQRGPENRERTERAVAARTLMYVFLVGAVVAAGDAGTARRSAHPRRHTATRRWIIPAM